MKRRLQLTPYRTVAIGLVAFVVYFSLAGWFRQVNLATSQFDMGNMDQTMWQTLHGRFFQMTEPGSPVWQSRAVWHTDFLLLVYAPFYALWSDPRMLLILQVLIVASGIIPLYWLARRRIGNWPAVVLAWLYLLFPALQHGLVFDVHAVVLVTPLLLWAWWAATVRRWWVYYPMILLTVLGKEEVGVTVAVIGLYWIWKRGYRLMGTLTILLGLGTSIAMLGLVIPWFRGAPGHFAINNYAQFGDTPGQVFRHVLLQPGRTLSTMVNFESLGLYTRLLIPVAGVALLGWPILLLAIPELAINLLSTNPNQHTILFQYMSVVIPFIFLASIEGYARVQHRWPSHSRQLMMSVAIIGLFSVWLFSPLPGMRHHATADAVFTPSPYRTDVQTIQQQLRPSDKVVATNNILPQFSRRDLIWGFPYRLEEADAIIVLEGGEFEFKPAAEISAAVQALQNDQRFTLVFHHQQLWFFKKTRLPLTT